MTPKKSSRLSVAGGQGKMGFRASNALASIQAFQDSNRDSMKRASVNLGIGGSDNGGAIDAAELKIENERLKTTLMILN